MTTAPVVLADIQAAARRIEGHAQRTPLLRFPELDRRLGCRAFVKPECLQVTGSFKFRGAYNKIRSAQEAGKVAGVVAFSSGNHAQGVAAAAAQLGVKAIIVMPADAPRIKLDNTRGWGAEVVLFDRYKEDREAIARGIATDKGYVLVPPYDDPAIISGQGTIGLEIVEDMARLGLPDLDEPALMASDGFHPGPAGHRLWADLVARAFLERAGHRAQGR